MGTTEKIIVLADPHIHNYSQHDKQGSRLANCVKLIEEVIDRAKAEGIRTILCCGDWFDKATLPASVINASAKLVAKMDAAGIRLVTISGNHDMYTTPIFGQPKGTALEYMAELSPNVHVIDDTVDLGLLESGTLVWGIPYYDHAKELSAALDHAVKKVETMDPDDKAYRVLVIHQTPVGLDNDLIKTETDPADPRYDHFDLILCGHIHTRQKLTSKFLIVGTPIHRSNEDAGLEKGYYIARVGPKMRGRRMEDVMEFVSTRGRYPEFRKIAEGAKDTGAVGDYVTVVPTEVAYKSTVEDPDRFNTSRTPRELIEAYWAEAGGNDEALLKTGLSLLK